MTKFIFADAVPADYKYFTLCNSLFQPCTSDKGLITKIPKTPAGNKKVDNGQLPVTHPPILRLADHNHRNRCLANKFYNLEQAPQKKKMCTTADAE